MLLPQSCLHPPRLLALLSIPLLAARLYGEGVAFEEVTVAPWYGDFYHVQMPGPRTIYISAHDGDTYLVKSTDGGKTWSRHILPYGLEPKAFEFLNESVGYTLGSSHLMGTKDGGETWTDQGFPYAGQAGELYALDENRLWVMFEQESHRTNDGGATWTRLPRLYGSPDYTVFFVNEKIGYAGGPAYLLKSHNGGDTWGDLPYFEDEAQFFPPAPNDVYFLNERKGFVATADGKIASTEYGGLSWKFRQVAGENSPLNEIEFVNEEVGFVVGDTIYRTSDGGTRWTAVLNERWERYHEDYRSVDFFDEQRGVAVGFDGRIVMTDDGGVTWEESYLGRRWAGGLFGRQLAVNMAQAADGVLWSVETERLYRSLDGGAVWKRQRLPSAEASLWGLAVTGSEDVWVHGDGGRLWRRENEGAEWESVESGVTDAIVRLTFPAEGIGWAVGNNGLVLRSGDDGATWQAMRQGDEGRHLLNIRMADDRHGWAWGSQTLLRTGDGGVEWEPQLEDRLLGEEEVLRYVHVLGSNQAAVCTSRRVEQDGVVGIDYILRRTYDGGKSWETELRERAVGSDLWSFDEPEWHAQQVDRCEFVSLVPGHGLFRSLDGGLSWSRVDTGGATFEALQVVGENLYLLDEDGAFHRASFETAPTLLVGIFSTAISGGQYPMTLSFESEPDAEYQIEYSHDLTTWRAICDRVASGGQTTEWTEGRWGVDTFDRSNRFYRVSKVTPASG